MRKTVNPLTYICECGKKWVFTLADAHTARQCDCGRTIVVQQQAVYSRSDAGAQKNAVAAVSTP